jgi:hypothetical protein
MTPEFLSHLRARSAGIQDRWRTLLHIEPVSGPLANPAALQYMIPEAWDRLLAGIEEPRRTPLSLRAARAPLPSCNCGNNPYRAFFIAGEQAVAEAAVLIQAEQPAAQRSPGDLAEVIFAVRSLARTDIDTFCSACAHKGKARNCRFPAPRSRACVGCS